MRKLIYDTDLIGDDLLTVMLIAASDKINLMGITAYGRAIGAQRRCEIAQDLLEMVNARGVDLVKGASRPLIIEPVVGCKFCDHIIEDYISARRVKTETYHNDILDISAAEYIIREVNKFPNEISLLCTGPLTNLALAVKLDPSIVDKFADITIMGGTYKVRGNSSPVAEANFFNDPDAARIVLDNFSNINIVTLDTTLKVIITDKEIPSTNEINDFVNKLVRSCCDAHVEKTNRYEMPLHDALAFLSMIDSSLVTFQQKNASIEIRSKKSLARLICSERPELKSHNISTDVDIDKSKTLFFSLMREYL